MKKQKLIISGVYALIGFVLALIIFNIFNKPLSNFRKEYYVAKPSKGYYFNYTSDSGNDFEILYPLADIMPNKYKFYENLDVHFITFSLDNTLSNKNVNKFAVDPKAWDRKNGRIGFTHV